MEAKIQKWGNSLGIRIPITSNIKNYPFEVAVNCKKITGVVLSDQVKNLDWRKGKADFIEKAPASVIEDIQEKLTLLIN